jgi:hypothetical protein
MPVVPVMVGCIRKEDQGPGWPGQKMRPYFQNKQSKKGWRHGSKRRASAWHHEALNSNSSSAKRRKKKRVYQLTTNGRRV